MSEDPDRIRRTLREQWRQCGPPTAWRVRQRLPAIARLAGVIAVAFILTEAAYLGATTLALATLAPLLPEIREIDSSVANALQAHVTPALTVFFLALTMLGSGFGSTPLTAALGWALACRRAVLRGAALALLMLGGWGLSELTKLLVQRARPDEFRLATATGYSFPSGHALLATCLYGGIVLLFWGRTRGRWRRVALIGGAAAFAISIGLSRVYLGVHYPTDVIGGWIGGLFWLIVFRRALRYFVRHHRWGGHAFANSS